MRKSDKKLEKQLIEHLTQVCDELLALDIGFKWLTHLIDFDRVAQSLKVICVFDTDANLQAFHNSTHEKALKLTLQKHLKVLNIQLAKPAQQILYDTEEACLRTHSGKWAERLKVH
ncbi:Fis family transcriptional regulator [Marinomonas ostreistagni]|uniref:Fis family transcriptional regulator n=1 Tax=Marinomonas ostreistagni TaxID=359209 RepID=UPI00194FB699|nr:Fis family transcriptional regulator [Marinomonas ostreistagni]MBM6551892.1 Fis family transcriptional regulator [Marinomonas ostreistagni]